jgi:hypothetical protein
MKYARFKNTDNGPKGLALAASVEKDNTLWLHSVIAAAAPGWRSTKGAVEGMIFSSEGLWTMFGYNDAVSRIGHLTLKAVQQFLDITYVQHERLPFPTQDGWTKIGLRASTLHSTSVSPKPGVLSEYVRVPTTEFIGASLSVVSQALRAADFEAVHFLQYSTNQPVPFRPDAPAS